MLINLNENISYFAQNISRSLLQIYNCIYFSIFYTNNKMVMTIKNIFLPLFHFRFNLKKYTIVPFASKKKKKIEKFPFLQEGKNKVEISFPMTKRKIKS